MPQMFPLMWFYLFISTTSALLIMSTFLHFYSKPKLNSLVPNPQTPINPWKW